MKSLIDVFITSDLVHEYRSSLNGKPFKHHTILAAGRCAIMTANEIVRTGILLRGYRNKIEQILYKQKNQLWSNKNTCQDTKIIWLALYSLKTNKISRQLLIITLLSARITRHYFGHIVNAITYMFFLSLLLCILFEFLFHEKIRTLV